MKYKKYDLWLADLNPRVGTETGKTRPVLIVQTDLLNKIHPSIIICPITSNVKSSVSLLRVNLVQGEAGLLKKSAVMMDQIRAIDQKRFIKKIGTLSKDKTILVENNLKIILDLI